MLWKEKKQEHEVGDREVLREELKWRIGGKRNREMLEENEHLMQNLPEEKQGQIENL